jgi:mannose/fructose-specific phosphotransferase system component IIA
MIEIILVSHGNLATGILDSSKMIYGDLENVKVIQLTFSKSP